MGHTHKFGAHESTQVRLCGQSSLEKGMNLAMV